MFRRTVTVQDVAAADAAAARRRSRRWAAAGLVAVMAFAGFITWPYGDVLAPVCVAIGVLTLCGTAVLLTHVQRADRRLMAQLNGEDDGTQR
jgi:Flp pilus assembly protein TadB